MRGTDAGGNTTSTPPEHSLSRQHVRNLETAFRCRLAIALVLTLSISASVHAAQLASPVNEDQAEGHVSEQIATRLESLDASIRALNDSMQALLNDRITLRGQFDQFKDDQKTRMDDFFGTQWNIVAGIGGAVMVLFVATGMIVSHQQRLSSKDLREDAREYREGMESRFLATIDNHMASYAAQLRGLDASLTDYKHPETIKEEIKKELSALYRPAQDILTAFNSKYDTPEKIKSDIRVDVARDLDGLRARILEEIRVLDRANAERDRRIEERIEHTVSHVLSILLQHDGWPEAYRRLLTRLLCEKPESAEGAGEDR